MVLWVHIVASSSHHFLQQSSITHPSSFIHGIGFFASSKSKFLHAMKKKSKKIDVNILCSSGSISSKLIQKKSTTHIHSYFQSNNNHFHNIHSIIQQKKPFHITQKNHFHHLFYFPTKTIPQFISISTKTISQIHSINIYSNQAHLTSKTTQK